jgi:hypothetical protein
MPQTTFLFATCVLVGELPGPFLDLLRILSSRRDGQSLENAQAGLTAQDSALHEEISGRALSWSAYGLLATDNSSLNHFPEHMPLMPC